MRWKAKNEQIQGFQKQEGLEGDIFENGAVIHPTQFTKTLKELANYVQVKYSSNVARMIQNVERPVFKYPTRCIGSQEKVGEMAIFIWRKDNEKVPVKQSMIGEKEMRVLPIILGSAPLHGDYNMIVQQTSLRYVKRMKNIKFHDNQYGRFLCLLVKCYPSKNSVIINLQSKGTNIPSEDSFKELV